MSFSGIYGTANVVVGSSPETNIPFGLITTQKRDTTILADPPNLVDGILGLNSDRAKNPVSIMANGSGSLQEAF